jgi:hypothetical protein
MPIGVDYSAWLVQGDELKRTFTYTDSGSKKYIATIHLTVAVDGGDTEFTFIFTPFKVVDGLDLGLSLSKLDGGRPAPVGVDVTVADMGQGAQMVPRTPQGRRLLLTHLLSGDHLKFGIFQGPEQLVDMPFYNDDEFSRLYDTVLAKSAPTPPPPQKRKGWFGLW